MTDAELKALVEQASEAVWQAESLRAAMRPRLISWAEAGDHDQYRFRGYVTVTLAAVEPAIRADERAKAEAEVERLRGLLRRAGAALFETGNDHPVLQDIDDALPPGWVEDKPAHDPAAAPAIRADERARLAERLEQRALKFRLRHKHDTRDYVGRVALSRCADVLGEEAAAIRALATEDTHA